MTSDLNVFKGERSIEDFLDPGKHAMLPLVELPPKLNPYAGQRVRIYAKLMSFSPLGNVKGLPAFNMMQGMYQRGELDGVDHVIENSSGNTVYSLALAARQFGVENTSSFVPHEISQQKLAMLQFFGIQPIVNQEPPSPDAKDSRAGVCKAREMGTTQPDWVNPGQYENPDNPLAHEKWTAKQIWQQTEGRINVFCAGLGTTGTLLGTATELKRNNDAIRIVGVMREDANYVPGVRTEGLLELIDFDWRAQVDHIEKITTAESYRKSMQLSRSGIIVGPSSGFALCGLLGFLEEMQEKGALDDLRNDDGEIHCVFICPDGPTPYLDEYFKYLDSSEFPAVKNEELLVNKSS